MKPDSCVTDITYFANSSKLLFMPESENRKMHCFPTAVKTCSYEYLKKPEMWLKCAEILYPSAPTTGCQWLLRPFPSLGATLQWEEGAVLVPYSPPLTPLHSLCLVLSKDVFVVCPVLPGPSLHYANFGNGEIRGGTEVSLQALKYQKRRVIHCFLSFILLCLLSCLEKKS